MKNTFQMIEVSLLIQNSGTVGSEYVSREVSMFAIFFIHQMARVSGILMGVLLCPALRDHPTLPTYQCYMSQNMYIFLVIDISKIAMFL